MIPKTIFFIWLGNNKPTNADWVMNNFKKMNPDFFINFIEDTFENPKNADLSEILSFIQQPNSIWHRVFTRKWAICNLKGKNGLASNITDCLKYYLINKYGGIYLDLDTFPVKKFDDKLLNRQAFIVQNNGSDDSFFIGCEKNNMVNNYHFDENNMIRFNNAFRIKYVNSVTIDQKKQFLEQQTPIGFSLFEKTLFDDNYYIDHYYCRNWKKNNI